MKSINTTSNKNNNKAVENDNKNEVLRMKNNLFNKKEINKLIKENVQISKVTKEDLENARTWAKRVEEGQLNEEKANYPKFEEFFFKNLGYTTDDYKHEEALDGKHPVDYYINGVAIEVKGAKHKDLTKRQARMNSPVEQGFIYASAKKEVKWIIVTNYKEFRLYNYELGQENYISFTAESLTKKENLEQFKLIFSKKGMLEEKIPEKLLSEKKVQLKKIEQEMYNIVRNIKTEYKEQLIEFNPTINEKKAEEHAVSMVQTLVAIKKLGDEGIIENPDTIEDCILIPVKEDNIFDKTIHRRLCEIKRFAYKGHERKGIPEIRIPLFATDFEHLNIPDTIEDNEEFFENRIVKAPKEIEDELNGYKEDINPLYKHILQMCQFDFTTEINDDIFGNIFERIMDDENRHDTGATYTPKIITKANSEYTICKYLSNGKAENIGGVIYQYKKNPRKLINKLKDLKIVDPACGSGNFLLGVIDVLKELYKCAYNRAYKKECDDLKINQKIITNNIYGVDLNPEAIEIAKLSIYLKVITSEHKEHYKIEDISKHIKAGNSVITKEFNWEKEFPEVFEQGGFDIVIGNPPYVKHHLINELKPELKEEYEVYAGRGDLYIYFFEKAIKLLKENGIMSFICSNTYTTVGFGKKLRAFMLQNTILKYTDHTGEDLFNAVVNTSSIFIQKAKPSKKHEILINNKHNLKQSIVTKDGFYFDEQTITLQQIQIKPKTTQLDNICYISLGMQLNSKETGKFKNKDLISDTKDERHKYEYIEGKDIETYNIKRIRYIEYGEGTRVPTEVTGPRFPELQTAQEKIHIKQIGTLKAIYDNQQIITNNTLFNAIPWKHLKNVENNSVGTKDSRKELEQISETYNTKYIVAIINSPVGTLLLNQLRGTDIHIYASHLKQIPIAEADTKTQNKIAEQVDILMDKNASNNAKANAEATINKTIYEIYQLTEEEIAIINDSY